MKRGFTSHCAQIPCYSAELEQTSVDLLPANLGSMWFPVFTHARFHVFTLSVNDVHRTRKCTHGFPRISCDACHGKHSSTPNFLRESGIYVQIRALYILYRRSLFMK